MGDGGCDDNCAPAVRIAAVVVAVAAVEKEDGVWPHLHQTAAAVGFVVAAALLLG